MMGDLVAPVAPHRPGHTPLDDWRFGFAPLSSGTKGAGVPGCAGMTGLWFVIDFEVGEDAGEVLFDAFEPFVDFGL